MVNLLVQWMCIAIVSIVHPFYLSVIDIHHNAKEKSLEISVRVFTEDLEKAVSKQANQTVNLLNATSKTQNEALLLKYMQKNLQLVNSGQPLAFQMIGFEQQGESIWTYLEVANVTTCKQLQVKCSLLYNFETRQNNIIHVKANQITKSYKLAYPETNANFQMQ